MRGNGSARLLAQLAVLPPMAALACAGRPPDIPARHVPNETALRSSETAAPESLLRELAESEPADFERADFERAESSDGDVPGDESPGGVLRMPPSRAGVLDVLSRFQSSIASGQPPLGDLLSEAAGLSAPGTEARRGSPSRSTIIGALGANFADPALNYDPFDVTVRPGERGAIATVPLEPTAASSPRRIVLSLHLDYSEGGLLITDIALSRSP